MVPSQNIKARVAMVAQTVGTATTNVYGNTLDVRGYDSATFVIECRSITVSSVPTHVLIEHSDDTVVTNFAAISGGTITASLPTEINSTAVTNQDAYGVIGVDLRGKKRYLRIGFRATSNVATMSSVCVLDNPGQAPINATDAGSRYFNAVG